MREAFTELILLHLELVPAEGDGLPPKLLSGELRVPEAEKISGNEVS